MPETSEEIQFTRAGDFYRARRPGCQGFVFVPTDDFATARARLRAGYRSGRHSVKATVTEYWPNHETKSTIRTRERHA